MRKSYGITRAELVKHSRIQWEKVKPSGQGKSIPYVSRCMYVCMYMYFFRLVLLFILAGIIKVLLI